MGIDDTLPPDELDAGVDIRESRRARRAILDDLSAIDSGLRPLSAVARFVGCASSMSTLDREDVGYRLGARLSPRRGQATSLVTAFLLTVVRRAAGQRTPLTISDIDIIYASVTQVDRPGLARVYRVPGETRAEIDVAKAAILPEISVALASWDSRQHRFRADDAREEAAGAMAILWSRARHSGACVDVVRRWRRCCSRAKRAAGGVLGRVIGFQDWVTIHTAQWRGIARRSTVLALRLAVVVSLAWLIALFVPWRAVGLLGLWLAAAAATEASAWGAVGAGGALALGWTIPVVRHRRAKAKAEALEVRVIDGVRFRDRVVDVAPPRMIRGLTLGAVAGSMLWVIAIVAAAPVGIAPAGAYGIDRDRPAIVPLVGWMVEVSDDEVAVIDPAAPAHVRRRWVPLLDGGRPEMRGLAVLGPMAVRRSVTACVWWCAPQRTAADDTALADAASRIRSAWLVVVAEDMAQVLGRVSLVDGKAPAGTMRWVLDDIEPRLADGTIEGASRAAARSYVAQALERLRGQRQRLDQQKADVDLLEKQLPGLSVETAEFVRQVLVYRRLLEDRLGRVTARFKALEDEYR
jgi:hypothetical protein